MGLGSSDISTQSIVPSFAYTAVFSINNKPLFNNTHLYVYSLTLPTVTFSEVSINIENGTFRIPGRQSSEPLSLKMYSYEDPVKNIDDIYKMHIIGKNDIETVLQSNNVDISFFDISTGASLKNLQFHNIYISSFSIDTLSWNTNSLFDINVVFYVNKVV